MANENVTIYLNTPLMHTQDKALPEDGATIIKGKIIEQTPLGPIIQIKATGTVRDMHDSVLFKKILLPAQKIDFMVVE